MFGASMRVEIRDDAKMSTFGLVGEGAAARAAAERAAEKRGLEAQRASSRQCDARIPVKPAQAVVDSDDGDLGGMSHDGDDVQ